MRILIVEDEEKLAISLKKGLEREGFSADYVLDGEEAEKRITYHHGDYDVIMMDVMLPKKDGYAICKEIRSVGIDTPVLMLTAKSGTEDKIVGLDSGADDYLIKPFSFEELLARLRALLRRPHESLPKELRVDDLVLNTVTRTVIRREKEITLTLKEFELLEYLMRNKDRVLNREQILSHAWDFNFDSFSNVIDVHIKNLRRKVDGPYAKKLIETVRGVGYRIKE
jgi:DNA-binding response OmpR family regulator